MEAHASYANGASRQLTSAKAGGNGDASNVEPLRAVLAIGKASSGITVGVVIAILLHGTAAGRAALIPIEMFRWTQQASFVVHERLATEIDLDVVKEPEAPPPPPTKEEPKEEAPPPPPVAHKELPKEPPPPPAAARAGAVLTAEPDPNEPLDLTNSIVTGTSTVFAGGTTQRGGTSDTAVRNTNARAEGVPGGTGTAPSPAPVVDRSRAASCGVDTTVVTVRTTVNASGTVMSVDVLKDPGHGFGREAKRCAMTHRCRPALDVNGSAVDGVSKLNITFSR
jgi:periplasmic protein TonB